MSSVTCLICPNGCGLTILENRGDYNVRGNRCSRGVDFARQVYKKQGKTGFFESVKSFPHYTREEISSILALWDLNLESIDHRGFILGSPERSLFRNIVYTQGKPLILEQIDPVLKKRHEATAGRLINMKKNGLPVSPYIRGKNGFFIQNYDRQVWQLTPFVQGTPLNRNNYWQEEWRGRALGKCICRLYELEKPDPQEPLFDLISFIYHLFDKITHFNSKLLPRLLPVLNHLEQSIFPFYEKLPRVFGHGDPHPLNIIWGKKEILTLIDWEFCGTKPLLYDASLIMGCVGSESRNAFDGPFNRAFYHCLRTSDIFSPHWLKLLPSFILAQRFAWLNEWLRHEDDAMIEQEISYMEMLL